jgi:putative lipoic acid-binding regulatory protein
MTDSPLDFPCNYPIKIMGLTEPGYQQWSENFVAEYARVLSSQYKFSKNRKYISVTVNITATSMTQLNEIYKALQNHVKVKSAL